MPSAASAALRRSPRLATLTIAWSIYWAAFTSAWFYAAPLFEERGASDAVLGFALGAGMLVGAAFSWAGGRIAEQVPLTVSVGVTSLVAAAALVIGPALPDLLLPVLVLLVVAGVPELVYVTLCDLPPAQHPVRVPGDIDVDRRGLLLDPDAVAVPAGRISERAPGVDVRLLGVRGDVAGGGGDVHRLSAAVAASSQRPKLTPVAA